jgi:hypothetical protein
MGNRANAEGALCAAPVALMFSPGAVSIVVNNAVIRGEIKCYTFEARNGQHAKIFIQSPGDNAAFAFYPPGWKVATQDGVPLIEGASYAGTADGDDAKHWSGYLSGRGRQLIAVGSTWGGASYTLTVEIDPIKQ